MACLGFIYGASFAMNVIGWCIEHPRLSLGIVLAFFIYVAIVGARFNSYPTEPRSDDDFFCDYCQRLGYDCRDCIVTEWKEDAKE